MGWISESSTSTHEAALIAVFDDGVESGGQTTVDGAPHEIVGDSGQTRPSAEIVGWRLRCYCANTFPAPLSWEDRTQWMRCPSPRLEDLSRRRIFAQDDEVADVMYRDDVAAEARKVWQQDHVVPHDALEEIRQAANNRRDAETRLDAAVAAARRVGKSWLDIGRAAGMSRQSAHERWRDLDQEPKRT